MKKILKEDTAKFFQNKTKQNKTPFHRGAQINIAPESSDFSDTIRERE